ncbi:hypothetical protein K432DRAFT_405006 [Lepidopterella palustris CBS 459.81]|uniref:Uncharacterized protein n=1 Tax=Lepidopterella palustris CBS 459.81 TaxID=1314670 RepID=A0A8E2EAQ6_9PEZI|nr:hypothetical protein K432DRAFT_405006 [Lepidopterella palustris CBS 459.81]
MIKQSTTTKREKWIPRWNYQGYFAQDSDICVMNGGKLKLADIRSKYFEEADRARARALGKKPPQNKRNIVQHSDRKWDASNDDEDQERYIGLLVAYGKGISKAELDLWEDEHENADEYDEDDDTDESDDCDHNKDNKYDTGTGEEEGEKRKCVKITVRSVYYIITFRGWFQKNRRKVAAVAL